MLLSGHEQRWPAADMAIYQDPRVWIYLDIFNKTLCPSLCIKECISMIRINAGAIMFSAAYVISDLTQRVMI